MRFPDQLQSSKTCPNVFGDPFRAIEQVTGVMTEELVKVRIKAKDPINSKPEKKKKLVSTSTHSRKHECFECTPLHLALFGYISYVFIFLVGYIREFIWGTGPLGRNVKSLTEGPDRKGYTSLYASFESFYTRNVYRRMKDVFNRPICSAPGAQVTLVERSSPDHFWTWHMKEASSKRSINMASYNYLGFAENEGICTERAIQAAKTFGLTPSSSRQELGLWAIHKKLEKTVARFLGTEDAFAVGMGFATNALNLPRLLDQHSLALSDEKNHASIILGLRLSAATVKVFKHNNVDNLEKVLRKAIIHGHPKTRRPWKKIFIIVEGVYSMEGSIVRLPEILTLKKKYGAYIYLDEAHSVGAMGSRGRGVVDYFGLDPRDVDIMMGTFTKSFGAAGGYIAGSKNLIDYLRINSQASAYPVAMSPPVVEQIIASMEEIDTERGKDRISKLARNARYFRQRLVQMGCIVYGHDDSPVVPLLLFLPAKIPAMVNGLLARGVASVGVGFPATPMTEERARFCVSAAHTKEMLDQVLLAIEEVAEQINVKYSRKGKYRYAEIVY